MTSIDEVAFATMPVACDVQHVAVVGLGYVGLPTALALFRAKLPVVGLDISARRLAEVSHGRPDLLPDDLALLEAAREAPDRFRVTPDIAALADADTVIVCVPTPVDESLAPDLTMLRSACAAVVAYARAGQTIILTSTSYVGCARELLAEPLRQRGFTPGVDVYVAFSPERINPGSDAVEHYEVPRVVGGATPECVTRASAVLSRIVRRVHRVSSMEAAEMAKLLENTFRAVNIALANEFSDVAHHLNLDPIEVIQAAATKPYGFMPFYPGPGVGGHCIPCDPHYLLWQLRRDHIHPPVISSAMQSISTRPARIVERAAEVLDSSGKTLRNARILVAGVAYKPDVADTRESPALQVIEGLQRRGVQVSVYDPVVRSVRVGETTFASMGDEVTDHEFDLVVVCCRHSSMKSEFRAGTPVLDATYRLPVAANTYVP